ncbi:MAG: hypothetical protein NC122_05585 [Faecalibacterium sp.]|nr:hypothetical protein [Ruminococcus sp.]MCM1391213.1 hypothetical protein [Ruminococcus sp.]MCM1485659.1 hypothetical protein [Faecalibacterium sp.]
MKKVLALLLAVIVAASLCSCSNDGGSAFKSKQPLTAENFTTLMDSNGFVCAIWGGWPYVFLVENDSTSFRYVHFDESLDIDYTKLSVYGLNGEITVYDESHMAMSIDPVVSSAYTLTFKVAYSDPKGDYIIFIDDDYEEEETLKPTIFMDHELLKSVWNKIYDGKEEWSSSVEGEVYWPSSVEEWVTLIDSCK